MAAIFSACLARLAQRLVPDESTLPPLILVAGHRPSHEQKCLTLAKRLKSVPISDSSFITTVTPRPLMWVRSTPRPIRQCLAHIELQAQLAANLGRFTE